MTTLAERTDEDAWHLWRAGGIGGSDIAGLIGLSPYSSPVSIYYDKIGVTAPMPETQRLRLGKRMEQVLALEFHDLTGLWCVGEQTWCVHPDHSWARCTVDGFAAGTHEHDDEFGPDTWSERALGTVQFKTDGRFGWPDGIPPNIRAQCVWEMGVTGLRHCWLVVMFAGFRIETFEIPWDEDAADDWDFMHTRAAQFWRDHIEAGIVPPMDEHPATARALGEVYSDPDPGSILDADDAARTLVARLQVAKATTKGAEATEQRLSRDLCALLGDRELLIDGWIEPGPRSKQGPKPNVLASWKKSSRSKVDLDGLRADAPELVTKHTTTSEGRRLYVPQIKES